MAAIVMHKSNNMNIGHQNLSRSLERILEDAALSGELKLSCRKLKDFPKIITKYNLSDTVIAGEFFFPFILFVNYFLARIIDFDAIVLYREGHGQIILKEK